MKTENESYRPKDRDLEWSGCYNVRDLGGLPAMPGKRTRRKAFVRSDVLGRLTSEGKRTMIDYGIRTVIDLRFPEEFKRYPAVSFADVSERDLPDYYNIPFGKDDPQFWNDIHTLGDPSRYYGLWIERYRNDVATILRTMLESRPGGIVFHCHSGKDRTGMLAALLLCVAGVSRDNVIEDYIRTNERLKPLYEAKLMNPSSHRATRDRIASMLEYLDTKLGGIRAYLQDAGIDRRELIELERRFVA